MLASAVLVGQPLAGLAGVIQVEHGGHRVHAQAVQVELIAPVQRVCHQEVAHFAAAEVEDVGAPVFLLAAAPVGVLVEGGAVETREREVVFGEVGGHPVHQHADAVGVQRVHEFAELVRGAPARGRGVVAGDLVAPGAAEGVLGHGQKLHVGEAVFHQVGHELLGQGGVVGALLPGADVALVDAHRGVGGVDAGARVHPLAVGPLELARRGHHGDGLRRGECALGQRVGLVRAGAVGGLDGVLVGRAVADAGDENLPHTGGAEGAHGVLVGVPPAEIADDGHTLGVRRPHGKGGAADLAQGGLVGAHVRAENLPEALVAALVDQVQIQ